MKKVVSIFITIIILLLAAGCYLFWYNMPINKINRAFEKEDYKEVTTLYSDLVKDEDMQSVKERLSSIASDYYESYIDHDISYKEAVKYFDLVTKKVLKKDKDVLGLLDNIKEIESSRDDYNEGMNLMEDKFYLEAIEHFTMVSKIDKENYKAAKKNIDSCIEAYCLDTIAMAEELMAECDYDGAYNVVIYAYNIFPEEQMLGEMLDVIKEYLEVDMSSSYYATYDLGDMIAAELGLYGYDVYFPAKLVFEFSDDHLRIYVDADSIESALDAMTADEESMKAVYALAEEYGIKKKEADLLISLTYGGSYTKFILDNYGPEIEEALADFTHDVSCKADSNYIYIGDAKKGDDYLTYTDSGSYMTLDSYNGKDGVLGLLVYPLTLYEAR